MKRFLVLLLSAYVLVNVCSIDGAAELTDLAELLALVKTPATVAVYESQIALYDAQKSDYKSQLGETEWQIKRYQESLDGLDEQVSNIDWQVESVSDQHTEYERILAQLHEQLDAVTAQVTQAEENLAALVTLDSDDSEILEAITELQNVLTELRASETEIDRQITSYEKNLVSLDKQGDSLDSQLDAIPDTREEYEFQISELRKNKIILQNQIDSISKQIPLLEAKIEAEKRLAKYKVQIAYFNVCLTLESIKVLENQMTLLDKQILVETAKLNLAMSESTTSDMEYLKNTRVAVEKQRAALISQAETQKISLGLLVAWIPKNLAFSIPERYNYPVISQAEISQELIKKSTAVLEYDTKITALTDLTEDLRTDGYGGSTTYKVQSGELALAQSQRTQYVDSLQQYAISKCVEFFSACSQSATMETELQNSELQLWRVSAFYSAGEISELEMLTEKTKILQSALEAKSVIVTAINSVAELEMMSAGVIAELS